MTAVKPYEQCATRLEQRGWHPPSKLFVDRLVEGLLTSGVEAVIHSAVSQDCQPLFPSKVFPNSHPEASREAFDYLIGELHAIGRPVLSWYSFNHSISIIRAHPDWRLIPVTGPGIPPRRGREEEDTFVCINSPYGELLPRFCQEIVRDVGFDGLWFDGSAFAVDGNSIPGCRCEFCRQRFRDDVGTALPDEVDWDSPDFRLWVNWRYDCLMQAWQRAADAILEVSPAATVCFNNYRRRRANGAWETGIPLRRLGWDALMSGELDIHALQGDFQMKMHRAYGCTRGQDSWQALCDNWNLWVPDVEPLPIQQAAVACAAAGGVMWMGSGVEAPLLTEVLTAAQEAASPLMPYVAGDPLEYAAIWISQQTQDFYYQAESARAWDDWHGANELCLQAHVQSSVLFDDQVAAGDMVGRIPVLLAGNTACVSQAQAEQLRRYVEAGGVLFACADFGAFDEMGWPHAQPLLDDFLAIQQRQAASGRPTLEFLDPGLVEVCGRWTSCHGAKHVLADPTDEAELLGHVIDHGLESWDNVEGQGQPFPRHPGLWTVKRGKGRVIYLGANLFGSHLTAATSRQVRLFHALVTRYAPPALTLDAPLQVTMNARTREDGSWIVHLHNAPGAVWRYQTYFNSVELVPLHDLELHLRDAQVKEAKSGLSGDSFPVLDDGRSVAIPRLHRNDVVVLHVEALA